MVQQQCAHVVMGDNEEEASKHHASHHGPEEQGGRVARHSYLSMNNSIRSPLLSTALQDRCHRVNFLRLSAPNAWQPWLHQSAEKEHIE